MLKRIILEQNLLFLRRTDGKVAALDDRCAHRQVPLSIGEIVNDCIECPYHGLQYNLEGQCVHNPHSNGRIPSRAVIKANPVEERYGAVWIWMGNKAKANTEAIPRFDFMNPEVAYLGEGKMTIEGNYQLETDNIMDLSHIEFVHPVFASPAVSRAGVTTEIDGNTVWSKRDIDNDTTPPDFIRKNFQVAEGPIDRWLHVH
jgi:vanillate O-demethylase monooxygenase subunit